MMDECTLTECNEALILHSHSHFNHTRVHQYSPTQVWVWMRFFSTGVSLYYIPVLRLLLRTNNKYKVAWTHGLICLAPVHLKHRRLYTLIAFWIFYLNHFLPLERPSRQTYTFSELSVAALALARVLNPLDAPVSPILKRLIKALVLNFGNAFRSVIRMYSAHSGIDSRIGRERKLTLIIILTLTLTLKFIVGGLDEVRDEVFHSRGDGQCLDFTWEPMGFMASQFCAEKLCDIAAAKHIICCCYTRLSHSSIGDGKQLIIMLWEGNRTRSRECTAKNNFLGKKNFLNLRNYFLKQENISCLKKHFSYVRNVFLCKKFFLM